MTHDDFYSKLETLGYSLKDDQQTAHQRLIKDLRDKDFDWQQIIDILENAK